MDMAAMRTMDASKTQMSPPVCFRSGSGGLIKAGANTLTLLERISVTNGCDNGDDRDAGGTGLDCVTSSGVWPWAVRSDGQRYWQLSLA
jgi:hypothetical protein